MSQSFRLHARAHPGRVRLQVAELERSVAFYEGVLGLGVLARGAQHASMGQADAATPLVELHERPGAAPVQERGRLGLFHFALLLPDRAALGAFITHLAARGMRAGAADHRVSQALYLQDPDGLGIEVYADRPRAAWRYQDGQLVMATDPLDLADVVAAAGELRWEGMPAGTTMGHIHLHVGHLEEAAAFYRDGLGLDATVWNYPGALFLSAGGYHHHLGLNTWAAGAPPAGEADARLLEWEMLVTDGAGVAAAAANLRAGGYTVEPAQDGVLARDPWGTTLRLLVEATDAPEA